MKYYQSNKKPLNYFERQKKRLHPKKYRYYFFDYMYYCGEKWGKKGARTSGSLVLFLYWAFCVMLPFGFYQVSILPLSDNERTIVAMIFSVIPPLAFCLLRYRKDRRASIMAHYRRSGWFKGIPVWLISSGWFPLCIVEVWILIEMG